LEEILKRINMASENEIVFSILNKIKPHLSDDTEISPREVSYEIAKQRALLIRNELNKNRTIDPDIIQDLGCVELELADPAECCDVSTSCKVMRTVLEIPNAIELHNDIGITTVGPVNKTEKAYSKTTFSGSKFVGNGKYTKDEIYYYIANNRVYLVSNKDNHKFITHINVRGVFENPTDAIPFTNCSDGSSCYSSDDTYPVKSWMLAYIEAEVLNRYVQKYNIPADFLSDGGDNTAHKQVK
jgi:hypothetical protein